MSALSQDSADRIDRENPENQRAGLGTEVKFLGDYAPILIQFAVTADATTALTAFTAPCAMRVDFVVANTTVGEASNTWTIIKNTSDTMFTALVATSDGLVSYSIAGATAATAANRILAAGDVVKVGAAGGSNGATQRGIITFIGHRV
jgi:hypothetical protein